MSTYHISQYMLPFLIYIENKNLFQNFRPKWFFYKRSITGKFQPNWFLKWWFLLAGFYCIWPVLLSSQPASQELIRLVPSRHFLLLMKRELILIPESFSFPLAKAPSGKGNEKVSLGTRMTRTRQSENKRSNWARLQAVVCFIFFFLLPYYRKLTIHVRRSVLLGQGLYKPQTPSPASTMLWLAEDIYIRTHTLIEKSRA